MTVVDPQRLASAMDDVLNSWQAETGQAVPTALFCAESHPWDALTLCRRLDRHSGHHASDGGDDWTTPSQDQDGSR